MKECTSQYTVWIVGTLLLVVLTCCQKKNEDTDSTKTYATLGNLQAAYAAEVRHTRWYAHFTQQAQSERLTYVAELFKAASRSEKIHAEVLARRIEQLGAHPLEPPVDSMPPRKTSQTIRFAFRTEQFECESLYPEMVRAAEIEKLPVVSVALKQTKDADARQLALFQNAVQTSGNISPTKYLICPGCGYIVTSVKTDQCPVCSTKNEQFEKI